MAARRFAISGLVVVMLTGLLLAGPVQAVTFSVGGWEDQFPSELPVPEWAPHGVDGYPGDTVEFIEHSGEFALVSGAVYEVKVHTMLGTIDYTWGGASAVSRQAEVAGVTRDNRLLQEQQELWDRTDS